MRYVRLPLPLLLALLVPATAAAQSGVPGGSDPNASRALRDRYYTYVMEHANRVNARWRSAWAADEVADLAELYTEDALLVPPNATPVYGREAIGHYLERLLPRTRDVHISLVDFDASEGMAYLSGRCHFEVEWALGASRTVEGRYVTILRRDGRTWRIRAHVFTFDEEGLRLPVEPSPASPRANPLEGLSRTEGRRAAYVARMLSLVQGGLASLMDAWGDGDRDGALRLYARDAVLSLPDGESVSGKEEIDRRLRDLVPRVDDVGMTLTDFDASGQLAFAAGRFFYRVETGGDRGAAGPERVSGPYLLVFRTRNPAVIRAHFMADDSD